MTTVVPVSTHSRLKAAGRLKPFFLRHIFVSTHSRLKAAGDIQLGIDDAGAVSTHSRLKAAGNPNHFGRPA